MGLTVPTLLDPQSGKAKAFGHLFEALAVLTVRGAAGVSEARAYHFLTAKGEHEVDILLENYEGQVIAFEVKLKASISDTDVRHLQWMKSKLGDRLIDQVVITTGRHAYRRKDGVAVVPLALLA